MSFPSWMPGNEGRIINRFITSALDAGLWLMTVDGETGEPMTPKTRKRGVIQRECAATGITVLGVYRDNTVKTDKGVRLDKVGDVVFIHGNGVDVLSDFSWPAKLPENEAEMERLVEPAQALAETLS